MKKIEALVKKIESILSKGFRIYCKRLYYDNELIVKIERYEPQNKSSTGPPKRGPSGGI